MKSRKNIRKTSNRKKNKMNRKKSRKSSIKMYKKTKYGGQDPPPPHEHSKEIEEKQRTKIGTMINGLKDSLKNNNNNLPEKILPIVKKEIFELINIVYRYRNMNAPDFIFPNDELYLDQINLSYDDFFKLDRYKDLNNLLDTLEKDFNAVLEYYNNSKPSSNVAENKLDGNAVDAVKLDKSNSNGFDDGSDDDDDNDHETASLIIKNKNKKKNKWWNSLYPFEYYND
jgi:hypothetical protein